MSLAQHLDVPGDWQNLVDKLFADATHFAALITQIPEAQMWEDFTDANMVAIIVTCKALLSIRIITWGR